MTDLNLLYLMFAWVVLVVAFFTAYWWPRKKKAVSLIAVHIDEVNGGM
jgi:hypothetical protein